MTITHIHTHTQEDMEAEVARVLAEVAGEALAAMPNAQVRWPSRLQPWTV